MSVVKVEERLEAAMAGLADDYSLSISGTTRPGSIVNLFEHAPEDLRLMVNIVKALQLARDEPSNTLLWLALWEQIDIFEGSDE